MGAAQVRQRNNLMGTYNLSYDKKLLPSIMQKKYTMCESNHDIKTHHVLYNHVDIDLKPDCFGYNHISFQNQSSSSSS